MKKYAWLVIAILVFALTAAMAAQDKPVIKTVPPSRTSAASGAEMFKAYCAVCHNTDGKGGGPAASALKKQPTDLTMLAKNNGGKFPELKVFNSIKGEIGIPAHGTADMPIWGDVFREMGRGDSSQVNLRLRNLTKYVESLQK